MKHLTTLVLLLTLALTSCALVDQGEQNSPVTPADYYSSDASYTLDIADDRRHVTLAVTRAKDSTSATVTHPEELSGMTLTQSGDLLRVLTRDGIELTLTSEVASGFTAFLQALCQKPTENSRTEDGAYLFEIRNHTAKITLGEDGYPREITVTDGENTRTGTLSFTPAE